MNSADYLKEMKIIEEKIKKLEKKIKEYEEYLPKLTELINKISPVVAKMKNAEMNYQLGGYISQGKTLSQGKLSKEADSLQNDVNDLNAVSTKTQSKIKIFNYELNQLKKDYENAKASYYMALAEEESG